MASFSSICGKRNNCILFPSLMSFQLTFLFLRLWAVGSGYTTHSVAGPKTSIKGICGLITFPNYVSDNEEGPFYLTKAVPVWCSNLCCGLLNRVGVGAIRLKLDLGLDKDMLSCFNFKVDKFLPNC